MAGSEGYPPGRGPETRHHRTIVTDLREMAGELDSSDYKGFFESAWGLMERPEVQDPEISAFLTELGSELTESDQWQEAKNYLLGSITIADSERNAKRVRRHFDLITALGLTEKLSENPEDAERLATLWDQYMGKEPEAVERLDAIKAREKQQQQAAEQVKLNRQQILDQIRFAQYPGSTQEVEMTPQPAYIPAESVYSQNIDGIAVIPSHAVTMISELGKGITGQTLLVRVSGLGFPLVLKSANADIRARYELSEEARALTAFKKQKIPFVPRIEGFGPDAYYPQVYMEYVEGETIDQLRDRTSPLPLDGVTKVDSKNWEMAYMCIQLLEALAQIHAAGVIHCDLSNKPDHLIWANTALPDGKIRTQLKVIDFGNVVYPGAVGNVSPKTYIHDVADAFGVILKYGFGLPIEERGLNSIADWERKIQATGNQGLIRVVAQIKSLSYKDARDFAADMMPIFERML